MLSEVADGQVFTGNALAIKQFQLTGKRLDERRLACAVGTQQANAAAGQQGDVDLVQLDIVVASIARFTAIA